MVTEESIRQRSYEIWMREGCPLGRALENWVRAEMELKSELRMRAMDPASLLHVVVPRPVITKRPLKTISDRVPSGCLRPIVATK